MTSEFLLGKDGGKRGEKVGRGGEGREDWRDGGGEKVGKEGEGREDWRDGGEKEGGKGEGKEGWEEGRRGGGTKNMPWTTIATGRHFTTLHYIYYLD